MLDQPLRGARHVPEEVRGAVLDAERMARYGWVARLAAGRRVLDAGCGMASGTRLLAGHDPEEVVGVDRTAEMLSAARADGAGRGLDLVVADIQTLPFADATFGLVVAFDVLEHVDDPLEALDELVRVLAPDGVLVASTLRTGDTPAAQLVPGLTGEQLEAAVRARLPEVAVLREETWLVTTVRADGVEDDLALAAPAAAPAAAPTAELVVGSAAPLPELPPFAVLAEPADWQRWERAVAYWRQEAVHHARDAATLGHMRAERDAMRALLTEAEQELARLRAGASRGNLD